MSKNTVFGSRMVLARKRQKITQEQLALSIGVMRPIIGKYERDIVKPNVYIAAKIAETLNVSLDFLIGLDNEELDRASISLIKSLNDLPNSERKHIVRTLNSLVRDARAKKQL